MPFKLNNLRFAVLLALLVSIASFALVSSERSEPKNSAELKSLSPEIKHARTAEEILIKLQRRHYEKRPFDDNLSSSLLDAYLENLDPNKSYFTQSDIASFEKYRFLLDDGIRRGDLNPGFEIFNQYRTLATNYIQQLVSELPERINALDFALEENITVDSDSLEWPADQKTRDNRMRKALKNAVLSLQLSDKNNDEIVKALEKRYKNQLSRLKQLNTEDAFQIYINSLVSLYDPHSNYMSPRNSENFSINMSLSLEGIGAVLRSDGEFTVVERLVKGGPAELQGELKPKDKITGVGQGNKGDIEDVVGWRLDEVVQLIRGKKNTVVRLEVRSTDSADSFESKYIKIVRNKVKLEEQAAQKSVIDLVRNDKLKKIGVIQVPTFYHDYNAQLRGEKNYRSTTNDVQRLLSELDKEGVEGVIIDLRGNGGGYLEEARTLTGVFVERGPVVQIKMANGRIKPESNYPNPKHYTKPMIVLIDRLSASASEIFAGAIQDYNRGLVVGSQSFGKGTVQQVTDLNHGALKLTEAKYYRISGDSTQHRGVIPNVILPSLYDAQEIGEDTLDYALEWDTVPPLRHSVYGNISGIESKLNDMHKLRVKDDPDYRYLLEQIALNQKYGNISSLPLNLNVRQKMIEEDKSARQALEDALRESKGLPPKLLDEDNENNTENTSAENTTETDEKEEEDPRSDFLLTEAANILLDAIFLNKKTEKATEERVALNR